MTEQFRWPIYLLVLIGAVVLVTLVLRLLQRTGWRSMQGRFLLFPSIVCLVAGAHNFGRTVVFWFLCGSISAPPLTEFGAFLTRSALLTLLIAVIFCVREEKLHG